MKKFVQADVRHRKRKKIEFKFTAKTKRIHKSALFIKCKWKGNKIKYCGEKSVFFLSFFENLEVENRDLSEIYRRETSSIVPRRQILFEHKFWIVFFF